MMDSSFVQDPQARVVGRFRELYGAEPALLVRAPGRVALLGAHIDYSDGWVMPAAIDRAVWLAASPRSDGRWSLRADDLSESRELELGALPSPAFEPAREITWVDYPAAVAWVLGQSGRPVPGMNAVFGGDLPSGAGVSSSAAVEVAFLLAASALAGDTSPDRRELARLAQSAENRYLGLGSGIMDPFASLLGRRDGLVFLDCRTHRHEILSLPPGLVVTVVDSGVRRRLATSGFNNRREQCEQAVDGLSELLATPLKTLRDVDLTTFERHAPSLPEEIRRRARHAVEEMARVRRAAEDLRRADAVAFGRAMRSSHESSRDLYEVSTPELDLLCTTAWRQEGCLGAKLMGGGFGGCVAILCRQEAVDRVEQAVERSFRDTFHRSPAGFRTRLADGAEILPS